MASPNPANDQPDFSTFTCFGKLPIELRNQIWREADASIQPRIIAFSLLFNPREAVPSLLQTCQEARTELLGSYTVVHFKDRSATPPLPVLTSTSSDLTAVSPSIASSVVHSIRKATSSSESSDAVGTTEPTTTSSQPNIQPVSPSTVAWWDRKRVVKLIKFSCDIVHIRDVNFLRDVDSPQQLRREFLITRNLTRFGGFANSVRRLAISDFLLDRAMFKRKSDGRVDFWCVIEGSFVSLEELVILSYGNWAGMRELIEKNHAEEMGVGRCIDLKLSFERFPDA